MLPHRARKIPTGVANWVFICASLFFSGENLRFFVLYSRGFSFVHDLILAIFLSSTSVVIVAAGCLVIAAKCLMPTIGIRCAAACALCWAGSTLRFRRLVGMEEARCLAGAFFMIAILREMLCVFGEEFSSVLAAFSAAADAEEDEVVSAA